MELLYDPVILLLGIYMKNPQILIWKNITTFTFTAALFTIVKIWKQPKYPSVDEWMKQLWYIYTMQHYSDENFKKEENFTLCDSMDGPGKHYAKWNKPVRERQVPYDFAYKVGQK